MKKVCFGGMMQILLDVRITWLSLLRWYYAILKIDKSSLKLSTKFVQYAKKCEECFG